MDKNQINWKKLLISILLCQMAGILGGLFTYSAIPSWYDSLVKPSLIPPNWAFSVVWPLLYLLMGVALYVVWQNALDSSEAKKAISVFGLQLFLNLFWSVLFFGLRSPMYGFIEIIFLWISIAVTIILFYRISKSAGLLLIPYILWVTFAAYLNYSVLVLNP